MLNDLHPSQVPDIHTLSKCVKLARYSHFIINNVNREQAILGEYNLSIISYAKCILCVHR